jgi:hypothetical protein
MSITGIFPPLLLGLFIAGFALWLYRKGRRGWALPAGLLAVGIVVLSIVLYLDDRQHRQARHDLLTLLDALNEEDLYRQRGLRDERETLFLFSTASQALYRGRAYAPDLIPAIDSVLGSLADWTVSSRNLPQWRSGTDWDRSVFFLAHAGAVLGHYQLATNREDHADAFRRIGNYLGSRLRRGHYKHLASDGAEGLLRPADNAAAIYALTLYDTYYAEQQAAVTRREWADYIRKELHYAESRLPCAAFTVTNRCRIEPSAAATGLYICYRAASLPGEAADDIPYREWLHYFKRFSGSPFSLSIRPNMRKGEVARLCDTGLSPLPCGHYEEEIGLWAAAEYGGAYTYFRLYSAYVFARWWNTAPAYGEMRPARRVRALTRVALRSMGMGA